jgi:PKD repeat protein
MKKLVLGLATCSLSLATLAQEPFKCATDIMRERLIELDPTLLQREAEYEEEIQRLIRDNTEVRGRDIVVTIPVVFHILHLGGNENISDEQIHDEIEVLNTDFRRLNTAELATAIPFFAGIAGDAEMQFALPTKDPLGNCTSGINRITTVETLRGSDQSKLKPWPRSKYLNVWVTKIIDSGAAGYAYKPGSAEGFLQLRDGIMILQNYVGRIGTSNPGYSRALTHEIGHYFNLDHTWGGTNEPEVACGDDGVEDTPITKGHDDCNNRFDYFCSSTNLDQTLDFVGVTAGGGTSDPTNVYDPRVIRGAGPSADTLEIGIDMHPTVAVGVSSSSTLPGELSYTGWDGSAPDGSTAYGDMAAFTNDNLDKYYEISLTPDERTAMTIQQVRFNVRRSETGPRTFVVRRGPNFGTNLNITAGAGNPGIQVQGGTVAFIAQDVTDWYTAVTVNIAGWSDADKMAPFEFRIYGYNAEDASGEFSIDNVRITGTYGEVENVENIMEYAYCQKMFTEDQVERMRAALNSPVGNRMDLWQDSTLQAVGIAEGFQMDCPPNANFYAIPGSPSFDNPSIPYPPMTCTGTNIRFKDNSTGGTPTSWMWEFQDGEPATSTASDPTITFTSPGWKSVTLTVTNEFGSSTFTDEFAVNIGDAESAMGGLGVHGFEEDMNIWPFSTENYENNITSFQRINWAGHTGTSCVFLNSGDRNFFDMVDPDNGGDIDELISPNMDLSGIQGAELSFWYSYSTQTVDLENVTEKIEVYRSSDCGRTWNFVSTQTQSTIQEADLITNGNSTTPSSWRQKVYTLPTSMLTSNVRFKIRFTSSEFSNHLFIDDIQIGGPVGLDEATGNTPMTVYPNPTNDNFSVQMAGMDVHPTEITLMDSRGAIVYQQTFTPQGGKGVQISSQQMGIADGLYILRASNIDGTSTQKLMVGR